MAFMNGYRLLATEEDSCMNYNPCLFQQARKDRSHQRRNETGSKNNNQVPGPLPPFSTHPFTCGSFQSVTLTTTFPLISANEHTGPFSFKGDTTHHLGKRQDNKTL